MSDEVLAEVRAAIPTVWLVACTLTAGWQKVFGGDVRVSFLAHARTFAAAANFFDKPAQAFAQKGLRIFLAVLY